MDITINNFRIVTDGNCYTLYKLGTVEKTHFTKEENVGKDKQTVIGYFTTIEGVFKALPDKLLLHSDATNLREAVLEVRTLLAKIIASVKGK